MLIKRISIALTACLIVLFSNLSLASSSSDPTILGFIKLNKTSISQLKKFLPSTCKLREWSETMYEIKGSPGFELLGNPDISVFSTFSPMKKTNNVTNVKFSFYPSNRRELFELAEEYKGILIRKYGPAKEIENNVMKWIVKDVAIRLEVQMPSDRWNSLMLDYYYIGLENRKKSHTESLL